MIQGAEHVRVMNTRLEGFSDGIMITPGESISGAQNALKHTSERDGLHGQSVGPTGPAVTIQPAASQSVSEIVFAECTFEPSQGGVPAGPGVYIDEGEYGATITDYPDCFLPRHAMDGAWHRNRQRDQHRDSRWVLRGKRVGREPVRRLGRHLDYGAGDEYPHPGRGVRRNLPYIINHGSAIGAGTGRRDLYRRLGCVQRHHRPLRSHRQQRICCG